MTSLKLTLPERLAREAESAGLLKSKAIERLIRAEIRRRRVEQMFKSADRLARIDLPSLDASEVESEIKTIRARRR